VFYGRNDWHYYLSQGYPLLLTTFLPFALIGLYEALNTVDDIEEDAPEEERLSPAIRYQLAGISLLVPFALSFISHKEVRFIYPILPLLHILSATSAAACFRPALTSNQPIPLSAPSSPTSSQSFQRPRRTWSTLKLYRPTILPILLLLNLLIALFTTQNHQRGVLSVMSYLRHEHETYYLTQPPAQAHLAQADTTMTVGFLMPCHSTPWRSHLIYPSIKAWALGCEPPVHIPPGPARRAYLDEADRFYADPVGFLERELGPPRSNKSRTSFFSSHKPVEGLSLQNVDISIGSWDGKKGRKLWPHYLVFFEGATEAIAKVVHGTDYSQCWRGWNSWVHDDWRRRGDVVVWCKKGKS
jgi:GPI mannosyltransferase 3